MKPPRVLAMILAGGKGSRMEMLTQVRPKPTLPFAGVYRLIDFPLSNCVQSRISDVWIVEQFLPYSLNKYLAGGRPWDLDRTYGGLQIIQPHQGPNEEGFHQGNADALYRNRDIIRDFGPELLLVLSADHVYKLDYSQVIAQHLDHNADVTMVVTQVPLESATRFGNVEFDADGKVTDFAYKPDEPQSEWVTTEVFVYSADTLLDTLEELVAAKEKQNGDEEAALEDFGHELIPHLVKKGKAYAFQFDGYWRDVGTIESYWEGHMDLLAAHPDLDLDDERWPILTYGVQRMPAHIHKSATIDNSLISPGCVVEGEVINSVLSPGVIVRKGAKVRNAVVLNDVQIEANATVEYAIIDRRATIGKGATVGKAQRAKQKKIALVGQDARVPAKATVPADGRVDAATDEDAFADTKEQVEAGR